MDTIAPSIYVPTDVPMYIYKGLIHIQSPHKSCQTQVERSLKREITGIWNSEMIRRTKPTPVDEAKSGLAVVEQVR